MGIQIGAISQRLLTADAWLRSQGSARGIFTGPNVTGTNVTGTNVTGTGFSPSASVFRCQ
jgi:hypothetical protein